MSDADVVIVGAGLAGLACARRLQRDGVACSIVEASDNIGGRVRTDMLDGFRLDRGFQILLTAYPEARAVLDLPALDLRSFLPGASVWSDGKFHRVVDPLRRPGAAVNTLFSPVGTLADKWRVAKVRLQVGRKTVDELLSSPETTTADALRTSGFSDTMIDRFFRPFLGGIFLEPDLLTTSRMFEFVFRMFSDGDASLPAEGMQAIPRQLAAPLPSGTIRLNSPVAAVEGRSIRLHNGEQLQPRSLVIATDGATAARLLPSLPTPSPPRQVACLYFAADRPPMDDPILVLNGEGSGPVNNLCVPNTVAPTYAPAGAALISATVLGSPESSDDRLEADVREHMRQWFGAQVSGWRHLRTYRIPYALPDQRPGCLDPPHRPVRLSDGLYICGDHRENGSIQGSLVAGRRAAEALLQDRT